MAKEQQISNTEFEVYNYLNTLNLSKGTRVWLPNTTKKLGDYLPGFVYGVYPFSFRGEFDNRLEIPKGMERSGLNRPDHLFYSKLNGEDTGGILVDCKWLLQYYRPDFVIIPQDVTSSLEFLNEIGYINDIFENSGYKLYCLTKVGNGINN